MKNTIVIISISIFFCSEIYAQEVSASLDEAKTAYTAGSLDDARFALEQSLQQIDQAIGKEILKILPTDLSGISYNENDDNVVGNSLGFAGIFVDRNYFGESKDASIEIIGDSPLMASVNAILAMPAIVTSGDENQKRIKIDGYKSLLQKDLNADGIESYTIQIPANTTLITLNCNGVSENEAIAMANQIPVSDIVKIAQ